MYQSTLARMRAPRYRFALIVTLFVVELLLLAAAYQVLTDFECRATGAEGACRFLRSMVARGLSVFAALALLAWAWPKVAAAFLDRAADHPGAGRWRAVHLGGVAILFLPLALAPGGDLVAVFWPALALWTGGGLLAALGGVLWLAPPGAWRLWFDHGVATPLLVLGVTLLVPDIAETVLPLWDWQVVTDVTFAAVHAVLRLAGPAVQADAAAHVIGIDPFFVHIARQCSGIEGVALMAAFVGLYGVLFRADLRMGRYIAVVLPVGLLLSWMLNVVRIAALVVIGARVSPQIAVNGFHSYAGWMFFTALALALLVGVQAVPWLHRRAPRAEGPRMAQDVVAAQILPFVVFMVVLVVANALFPHPDLGYPLVVLALALAVAAFLPVWRGMDWRPGGLALAAGAAVGLGWALTSGPGGAGGPLAEGLAALPAWALAGWIAARVLGTVVLVPLVEEMFFRGYLLARLDFGGRGGAIVSIAVTSLLFGALHGRWLAGALAGLVFALLALHRGRVTDAVAAHVLANLIVALAALATGDWTRI